MTRRQVRPGASIAPAVAAGAALALCLGAGPVGVRALGLRGGFSVSPGQWIVGVHEQVLGEDGPLGIVPSLEAGFGDDTFTLTAQGDAVYRFPHSAGPRPYLGAGGALYFADPKNGDSHLEGGLNVLGGVVLDPAAHPRVGFDGRVRLTDKLPKARVVVTLGF